MREVTARLEEKIDQLIKVVDRIDESVNGNGSPGLRIETDRNTQSIALVKKVGAIALTAILALMGALFLASL